MVEQDVSTKRFQVCNYILRIISKGSFDYISYYNALHWKLKIVRLIVYRSKQDLNEFIIVFACDRRRDVIVDMSNKILTPKFFHVASSNYPYLENNNSRYALAKVYEDVSMYEIVHESETVRQDLTLKDHVKAYAEARTYTQKLDYIETYGLHDSLHDIMKNAEAYEILLWKSWDESLKTPTDHQSLQKQIVSDSKLTEQSSEKQENNILIQTLSSNDYKDSKAISYLFDESNSKTIKWTLSQLKAEYDSNSMIYTSLLKVCLIHYKFISNPLRLGGKHQYLLDVFDYLPLHVKEIYQRYVDKYNEIKNKNKK